MNRRLQNMEIFEQAFTRFLREADRVYIHDLLDTMTADQLANMTNIVEKILTHERARFMMDDEMLDECGLALSHFQPKELADFETAVNAQRSTLNSWKHY